LTTIFQKLPINDARWLVFIDRHPSGSIFHHPAWIETIAECYGHSAYVMALTDQAGDILAGIPFMQIKSRLTGFRWVSLPYSDYCPPLTHSQTEMNRLFEEILLLNNGRANSNLEIRWHVPETKGYTFMARFVLHSLNLDAGLDRIHSNCAKTFRYSIRRAERDGLKVNYSDGAEGMQIFYQLHLKTRMKLGVPIQPKRFFELLYSKLILNGFGKVIIISHEAIPISAAIVLNFKRNCMIKYSASDPAYLKMPCQYYLYWKCIEWAFERKFGSIDFGKTDISNKGLRYFKNGWGTKEDVLPYSFTASAVPKRSSGRLHSMLRLVIRHSPQWVCRLVGELLYSHFG
jgi:hypothetical protein